MNKFSLPNHRTTIHMYHPLQVFMLSGSVRLGSKAVWCGNEISILEGKRDASRKPSSYWATPSYPRNLQKNTSRAFHCHVQLPEGNCESSMLWYAQCFSPSPITELFEMCTVSILQKRWVMGFTIKIDGYQLSALPFHPPFFY